MSDCLGPGSVQRARELVSGGSPGLGEEAPPRSLICSCSAPGRRLESFGFYLPSVWDLIYPKLGSRLLKKTLTYRGLLA